MCQQDTITITIVISTKITITITIPTITTNGVEKSEARGVLFSNAV